MNEKSEKILTSEFWVEQRILIKISVEVGKIPEETKTFLDLLVVPVFQESWFISGISDLVTVEALQNNERVGRHTLTDERVLSLVREVTDTDRRSTVGDTAKMCDLKRTTVQCIFKDRRGTIKKIANFLGRSLAERDIDNIMEHTSLENMKKNPAVNFAYVEQSQKVDKSQGAFINKGLTHGWRDEVPEDIQRRVDEMIKQELKDTGLEFD